MNESFADKLAKLGGQTVNKLYDFAEATKTNYDIGESKKKLANLYQDLGRLVYEEKKEEDLGEYREIFEQIDELRKEIDSYNPRLRENSSGDFIGNENADRSDVFANLREDGTQNIKSMDEIAEAFKKQRSMTKDFKEENEEGPLHEPVNPAKEGETSNE